MLFSIEDHAKNPPSSWLVVKHGRRWHLTTSNGDTLQSFDTKKEAEAGKVSGFFFDLYEKERRWFAGESIPGWKKYELVGIKE